MAERARAWARPLLYAHLVGGQDELVFDGVSFASMRGGELAAPAPAFEEELLLVDVAADGTPCGPTRPCPARGAGLAGAGTGVRDYLGKNGFPGAIIGLSGGIDSALMLAIAVDALGADKVRAVMMPSPYTAEISWIDARDMAARVGVRYDEISDRARCSTPSGAPGARSSAAGRKTPPKKTCRRGFAARC